jgi:peptide/nickel transport system substrate-binding protein
MPYPLTYARGEYREREALLIKVLTDDEAVFGWGESAMWGGPHAVTIAVIEREIAPLLLGHDPRRPEYLWEKVFQETYYHGRRGILLAALSGIDIALWDILGKAAGQPLWRLLGGFGRPVITRASRNPNYWRDTWFDEVELLSIIDPTARTNALLSGQIDYMDRVDGKTIKFMAQKTGFEIDKVTGYEHNVFSMNVTTPPFDNPDVRNAVKYAIDREAIIARVFGGIGTPGNDNAVAPAVRFATNPLPVHSYDPEMAKRLLAKAGHSGLKISLSAADAAFTGAVDAATVFASSAAKAGIELSVVREPNDGYWDNVWLKKPFVASQWLGRPTADGTLTFAYTADSNQNETFWKNPRFNELLNAARSELDETKRAQMYAECQQLLHDDGGLIVLMFTTYVSAHTKKLAHGTLLPNLDMDGFRLAQRWWAV